MLHFYFYFKIYDKKVAHQTHKNLSQLFIRLVKWYESINLGDNSHIINWRCFRNAMSNKHLIHHLFILAFLWNTSLFDYGYVTFKSQNKKSSFCNDEIIPEINNDKIGFCMKHNERNFDWLHIWMTEQNYKIEHLKLQRSNMWNFTTF